MQSGITECISEQVQSLTHMYLDIARIWEMSNMIPTCEIFHMGMTKRIWESLNAFG